MKLLNARATKQRLRDAYFRWRLARLVILVVLHLCTTFRDTGRKMYEEDANGRRGVHGTRIELADID